MIKKAFTLAEVLLVIAIIGTVAALTIPNLMDNYSEDYTVTQLRKLKNEFDTAKQKAKLKYDNSSIDAVEIMEFMDVTAHGNNIVFPSETYREANNFELKDGTLVSTDGSNIYVAIDGIKGKTIGKHIFGFYLYDYDGNEKFAPMGAGDGGEAHCPDKASNGNLQKKSGCDNISYTNWAVSVGNLDYMKCSGLNWDTKRSCD